MIQHIENGESFGVARQKINLAIDEVNEIIPPPSIFVESVNGIYGKVEITPASIGAAETSHGNHVPTIQTANNATFLRNDNTWQTVTPANIGAAPSTHAALSARPNNTAQFLRGDGQWVQLPPSGVTQEVGTWSPQAIGANVIEASYVKTGSVVTINIIVSIEDDPSTSLNLPFRPSSDAVTLSAAYKSVDFYVPIAYISGSNIIVTPFRFGFEEPTLPPPPSIGYTRLLISGTYHTND